MGESGLSYKKAGVDIDTADATKRAMARSLETSDARVLNRIGAFATLFDGHFPGYRQPVLVIKSEEPGSKQKLAFQHGRVESICSDLVNHLLNDIIVMGAHPLSVQDVIVCGKLEKEVVERLVGAMAAACRAQDCTLTGGETSEQPGVVEPGVYILTASGLGVVERDRIVDGARISPGDQVLAVASNGLHTNGYSLVRALLAQKPEVAAMRVGDEPFLDAILRPHKCYYRALRGLFARDGLHGMAHITGGGIADNLARVLPPGVDAVIDLNALRIPPVFRLIRDQGQVEDADMLRTFNMGVGVTLVVAPTDVDAVRAHLADQDCACYPIGAIAAGEKKVRFTGSPNW